MKVVLQSARGRWGGIAVLLGLAVTAALSSLQSQPPMLQGIRAVGALLLVVGVALVGVPVLKAWTVHAGARGRSLQVPIHVVGGASLGEGRGLVVVEVEGERFLLGLSRNRVALLSRLSSARGGGRARGGSEGIHEA